MKKIYTLFSLMAIAGLSACGDDVGNDGDVDVDFGASVNIIATSASVSEDAGTASFSITLSETNTSGSALSFPFTVSGTASESVDFSIEASPVSISNNQSSVTIDVDIIDDSDEENDETITLTFGSVPDGITLGSNTSATITIADNDDQSGSSDVEIAFGSASGNSITIDSWTDVSADSYIILMNSEDSFTDVSNSDSKASTTYVGYDEQVIFSGSQIEGFAVTMLSANTDYYFKVVPVTGSVFDNSQTTASNGTGICSYSSTNTSQVCFQVNESEDTRTISSNQYPSHAVGNFPNASPTAIEIVRELDLSPEAANEPTYLYSELGMPTPSRAFWKFGIASNGVEFHPMGLQPWENPDTGEQNWAWQAKVTEQGETNLDAYGAHVTTQGNYHYHGDIVVLADDEDGSKHSVLYGFAGDGFPIYYKYGYSTSDIPSSGIKELKSSYRLRTGTRSDTGTAGEDYPSGSYDGTYIQDFEYVEGLGDLDECNGRTGITPEFPQGTYYYVITSDFPVAPNCFYGTPADDWQIGN